MSVKIGATLVLEKSFAFPQAIFDRIRAEGVTASARSNHGRNDPSDARHRTGFVPSVRYLTNTAAALPVNHIARLRELFPGARVYSMYGLTECKRCAYLPPEELDRRPGSVEIAIPGTEAMVVDDNSTLVPSGVPGELVIRGAHVMQGYWENEAATNQRLRPGRRLEEGAHTGDPSRLTTKAFSTSSAARTTSSRPAARRLRRRKSRPFSTRTRRLPKLSSRAFPTESSGRPS